MVIPQISYPKAFPHENAYLGLHGLLHPPDTHNLGCRLTLRERQGGCQQRAEYSCWMVMLPGKLLGQPTNPTHQ